MADEQLTLGELGRRLDAGLADIKEDIAALGKRVDEKVDAQVLALQQAAQDERHHALAELVATIRKERDEDARQLRETRRWLLGAIAVPTLASILPFLIAHVKL